jgi:hypothetical protein
MWYSISNFNEYVLLTDRFGGSASLYKVVSFSAQHVVNRIHISYDDIGKLLDRLGHMDKQLEKKWMNGS